jgi:hypothetical protein
MSSCRLDLVIPVTRGLKSQTTRPDCARPGGMRSACLTGTFAVVFAGSAIAQTRATEPGVTACPGAGSLQPASPIVETGTMAQRRLGQGVAMFDSSRYVLAADHLKAALALGLSDSTETAIANKYLGFYYCLHNAQKVCEQHMQRALTISPGFDLNPDERANPVWRDTYMKVVRRMGDGCTSGVNSARNIAPTARAVVASAVVKVGKKPSRLAIVELDVRPWGEVYIDAKQVAVTPPSKSLSLAPGVHRVEVRNQGGATLKTLVTVEAGDVTRLSHRF